jgi:DNA-binding NtrC family response regulator
MCLILFRAAFAIIVDGMILLVDDNRVGREAFAKILRLNGHEVMEAADAAQALEILNKVSIDLMITDFVMPGLSGVQLIEQIRSQWPRTRMLMMSGYLTSEVGNIVSDGVDFIPKPVDVSVLLSTINRIIPQRQSV